MVFKVNKMSEFEWKESQPKSTWTEFFTRNIARRQSAPYVKTCSSAPGSVNVERRNNSLRGSLRVTKFNESEDNSSNVLQRDRIAWQTISQHLSLQIQQRRRSELAANRKRMFEFDEENRKEVVQRKKNLIDDTKRSSTIIKGKPVESVVDLEEEISDETSGLLKTDVHIVPLEKLVDRFKSDLTNGLTDEMITQHRATYGENKLTPARPPSFFWMIIKQLLIGFNGILWIATLFAFLSYVRRFSADFKIYFAFCFRNHLVNLILI